MPLAARPRAMRATVTALPRTDGNAKGVSSATRAGMRGRITGMPAIMPGQESSGGPQPSTYNGSHDRAGAMTEPADLDCRRIAELLGDYIDGSLPKETQELID